MTQLGKKYTTRDPNRIPVVLKAVEEFWMANPDLRLGQLLVAAISFSGREVPSPEVFYLEDEDVLRGILELAARTKDEITPKR